MVHEIAEHAQMIIMPSVLAELKAVTGEKYTIRALCEAVTFTIKNKEIYKRQKKENKNDKDNN